MEKAYLFSKIDLRKLVIPLIIEQALAITVGMVDTIMVAGVGEDAVSGVALVDSVNILLIALFTALGTGGAVVAGQYLGLKELKNANHAAKQLVIAAFLLSVAVMAACLLLNRQILSGVFGRVEPVVMGHAQTYFYVTALSYPFIAVFNAAAALFRGMGDSKTPMQNALIMNVVNIIGNAVFIYAMDMGVAGAALSTLLSRALACVAMLFMLRNQKREISVRSYHPKDIDFPMIRRILKIGIPNGLENSMFQIGKIVVTSLVALQGTAAIAAHAVSNSLALVEIIPGAAVGLAILSVVARCVGAGEYKQAEYYTKYLMKRAYLYMAVLNVAMLAFMQPILSVYQLSSDTLSMALEIMVMHGLCAIAIWPLSFTLPNALRAAGDVKNTMVISVVSMWVFRIVLSYVFVYLFHMGVFGIWVAMIVDWVFRSALFTARWRSGKWKDFAVV
ncbi:MAG TPA: MATE family efflux transporter [Clostridiales bacterium]|nr:MATE family efflux transporter [Clostridiales bacterium]